MTKRSHFDPTIYGLCAELSAIEKSIRDRGFPVAEAEGYIHWFGHELRIQLRAAEGYLEKDHWHRSTVLEGETHEASSLLESAREWVNALPGPEQRTRETIISTLTRIADGLPSGTDEISRGAWEAIKQSLLDQAERISKNALPQPNTSSTPNDDVPPGHNW